EAQREVGREIAGADPGERAAHDRARVGLEARESDNGDERDSEGPEHRAARHRTCRRLADAPAEAGVDQEAEKRQENDRQKHLSAVTISAPSTSRDSATRGDETVR